MWSICNCELYYEHVFFSLVWTAAKAVEMVCCHVRHPSPLSLPTSPCSCTTSHPPHPVPTKTNPVCCCQDRFVFFIGGGSNNGSLRCGKLVNLVEHLDTAYSMEISAEKAKLMTNNTSGISTEVKVNGQKLETVTSFKYLGSVITYGSKPEVLSARLKPVWNDRSISLGSKIQLMHPIVTSIFLDACESWTLTAELQRRIQRKKGNEVVSQDHLIHLTQRRCYQQGSPRQDPVGNWTIQRPPDDLKETQTAVSRVPFIRSGQNHLARHGVPFIRSGQNHLARHGERGKKTR